MNARLQPIPLRPDFSAVARRNVAAVRFQRAAAPPVIAGWLPFRPRRTRAGDKFKIEIVVSNKIAEPPRGFGS
jgi:hypothetical protein